MQTLDYDFLLEQFKILKKLGPIKNIIGQIPGMRQFLSEQAIQRIISGHSLKATEAMILSMTPAERRLESPIGLSRRDRIARGAGTDSSAVAELQMQLDDMRRNMRDLRRPRGD